MGYGEKYRLNSSGKEVIRWIFFIIIIGGLLWLWLQKPIHCNRGKGWFSLPSRSWSRNRKRRAYDLVKKAFWFRLRLHRLRSAYDLTKTRLSESEELNQSQNVRTCVVIGFFLPLLLPTPTIWFSLDHKRNVSDGAVSGVGRNGNVLILLTPFPSCLWLR